MLDRSLSLDVLQKNMSLCQSEILLEQTSFFLQWCKCKKCWSITQKPDYCLSCSKKYEHFVTPDCDHFNQVFTSKI